MDVFDEFSFNPMSASDSDKAFAINSKSFVLLQNIL